MLTSVTGLFSFSVTVAEPPAYEPPAIATFAVCAVSDTSWKMPLVDATGFAAGKFPPLDTDSELPLTEITAADGGGLGGAGGVAGVEPEPDEPEPLLPLPVDGADGRPAANGSLLANRVNDSS